MINEVLRRNTSTPVPTDGGRTTDFTELYNNTASAVPVAGWKIRVESNQEGTPFDRTHTLPAGTIVPSRGHVVDIFDTDTTVNSGYAGFTLPAEAGVITLLRPDDTVVDRTEASASLENVSWSRFRDGHPVFRADSIPSRSE